MVKTKNETDKEEQDENQRDSPVDVRPVLEQIQVQLETIITQLDDVLGHNTAQKRDNQSVAQALEKVAAAIDRLGQHIPNPENAINVNREDVQLINPAQQAPQPPPQPKQKKGFFGMKTMDFSGK